MKVLMLSSTRSGVDSIYDQTVGFIAGHCISFSKVCLIKWKLNIITNMKEKLTKMRNIICKIK